MTTAAGPSSRSPDAPDRDVPKCPYVGLVPFEEQHAEYFFGRERESELIIANLTASRLTLLYATSGVGKTSVLRASVLPRLYAIDNGPDDDPDDPDDDLDVRGPAVAYVNTWRDAPFERIAAEVSDAVSRVTSVGAVQQAAAAPKLSVDWLRKILRQSEVSTIYLILDQFEEYFLYHSMDSDEKELTAELGRILSAQDLRLHVLLSIREDALARLDCFKGRVPHLFDNYLRLAHLSRDAAQAAIQRPLDHYNRVAPERMMSIDPDLVDALLDQVRAGRVRVAAEGAAPEESASNGSAPDGRGDIDTPYLQLVLTRLWERERATGSSSLQKRTLDDLGGAEKIVQAHVDNIMAGLSDRQLDVAAAVFRHLITRSGTKFALPADDLADLSKQPESEVQDLLDSPTVGISGPQRLLRQVPPAIGVSGSRKLRYEISHDVMATAVLDWCRRHDARRQQEEASRRLIGEREAAEAEAETARRQLRLINEREEARTREEAARRKLRAVGLGIVLLIVLVLSGFIYESERNARRQQDLAQAATALGHNPAQSLMYAVDAYHRPYRITLPWRRDTHLQASSAVLSAASNLRSHVVTGQKPQMIGMASTPDFRRIVAYDTLGNIRVIGENGDVLRKARASGLQGTVSPDVQAAVSPDASHVAFVTYQGDQGTVAVINTETGQPVDIKIKNEDGSPRAVTWIGSAPNDLVLVVSESTNDKVATTYHPETGEPVARFDEGVIDALPLADGHHIVTSGKDKRLRVWDARTGAKIRQSPTLDPPALALRRYAQSVVSPSVVSLSAGVPSSIVVWNWQAGLDPVRYDVEGDLNGVRRIVVNDSTRTLTIAQDKNIRTYHLDDGKLLGSLPPQAGSVADVAISSDGRWITTASADGRVLVWSSGHPTAPTYELLARFGGVTQVSYLQDAKHVMGLGTDGTVQRWELPQLPSLHQPGNGVVHLDLSRHGPWLATTRQDNRAVILDLRDLSKPPVATLPTKAPLRAVLFDPAEKHRILSLGRSGKAPMLWSWGGNSRTERLDENQKYVEPELPAPVHLVSLAVSPNGQMIAGGDTRGAIHLWDAATRKLRASLGYPGAGQPAYSVAFNHTGKLLAATGSDGVRLWKLDAAEPLALGPLSHPGATGVTFDPPRSGRYLVSTAGDGTVKIWTQDGKPIGNLVTHGHPSSNPSFSNDGRLLAVGTAEGLVEVWDVGSHMTVMLDRHHSASVHNVVFLRDDGSQLISASDDATVVQFDCRACTEPGRERVIQEAEEWVTTQLRP